jgi:hypothetical protein
LTLSKVESRVKLTRLVVESAKDVLAILECPSSTADNSDDGSVLVLVLIVKIASFNFFAIAPPVVSSSLDV